MPEFRPWFEVADDLNKLGLETLWNHETPTQVRRLFAMSAFMARAYHAFQAAVILAERGLIGEAKGTIRTGVEIAIALHALAYDPAFVSQLMAAHNKHELTIAQMNLSNPDYRARYSADEIKDIEAKVASITALKGASTEPASINWSSIASKHCPDLYDLLYRPMSADGVHATVASIAHHIEVDHGRQVTELNVGPSFNRMIETLCAACMTFLYALNAFLIAFPNQATADRLSTLAQRIGSLPRTEPVG